MKKIYTFTLALIVLILMAVSVSAQSGSNQQNVRTYTNGVEASADWYNPDVSGETFIDVIKTNDGNTQMYLFIDGFDTASGKYYQYQTDGYVMIPDNIFKNSDLNSASLSEIQIPVRDLYSNTVTLIVKADWIGTGAITKEHINENYGYWSSKGMGDSRFAKATGSINGAVVRDIGETSSAGLSLFKYITMIKKTISSM